MFCCDACAAKTLYVAWHCSMLVAWCLFYNKQDSFGFTCLLKRTIFARDAVNCPLKLRGANWIIISVQYITYFYRCPFRSSYFVGIVKQRFNFSVRPVKYGKTTKPSLGATVLRCGFYLDLACVWVSIGT